MEIKITGKKEIWQNIVNKVIGLRSEVVLNITQSGIHIKTTDEANVALVEHTTKSSAFDEYIVNEVTQIGVDLSKLNKHLKIFTGNVSVVIELNKLVFKGEKGQISKMVFIDYESLGAEQKIPELKFDVEATIPFNAISNLLRIDFDVDCLKFNIEDKILNILIDGDTDEVKIPVSKAIKLSKENDFTTLYSKDYLSLFRFKTDEEVTMSFGKDKPIHFEQEDAFERTAYFLAPRIEGD